MPFVSTPFQDLWVFEPKVFSDDRGYFYESFNQTEFENSTGLKLQFVQDNHSYSKHGVLRGLHFQLPPYAQSKFVRVLAGEVLDVVVDIRSTSPTFGQKYAIHLTAENKKQLFIPKGFAHGFVVLSPHAEFVYKCDAFYAPGFESGLIFNDPTLKIDWQVEESKIIVSDKDQLLKTFDSFDFSSMQF